MFEEITAGEDLQKGDLAYINMVDKKAYKVKEKAKHEENLCVECIFSKYNKGENGELPSVNFIICQHDQSPERAKDYIVTGLYKPSTCKEMRNNEDKCGFSGKLFTPMEYRDLHPDQQDDIIKELEDSTKTRRMLHFAEGFFNVLHNIKTKRG